MRHYLIKYDTNLQTFPEQKSVKPGSKFLFHFVDILELKVFTEGILDTSFITPKIRKILSIDRKKSCF